MFDNSENRLGEAKYNDIIGYCNSFDEAANFIKSISDKYTYRGWDNEEYPWYEIKPIKYIEEDNYEN